MEHSNHVAGLLIMQQRKKLPHKSYVFLNKMTSEYLRQILRESRMMLITSETDLNWSVLKTLQALKFSI